MKFLVDKLNHAYWLKNQVCNVYTYMCDHRNGRGFPPPSSSSFFIGWMQIVIKSIPREQKNKKNKSESWSSGFQPLKYWLWYYPWKYSWQSISLSHWLKFIFQPFLISLNVLVCHENYFYLQVFEINFMSEKSNYISNAWLTLVMFLEDKCSLSGNPFLQVIYLSIIHQVCD